MENTETLTDMVGRVASAMENAVIEYGPDAVDLAMLAYQFEAIRHLGAGGLALLITLGIALAYRKIWKAAEKCKYQGNTEGTRVIATLVAVILSLSSIGVSTQLLSPVHWIAAIGSPEILIATKALKSAGLL